MVKGYAKDLCCVNTDVNRADSLTKPLPRSKYLELFRAVPEESALYIRIDSEAEDDSDSDSEDEVALAHNISVDFRCRLAIF